MNTRQELMQVLTLNCFALVLNVRIRVEMFGSGLSRKVDCKLLGSELAGIGSIPKQVQFR
jgi:hypothetical protein